MIFNDDGLINAKPVILVPEEGIADLQVFTVQMSAKMAALHVVRSASAATFAIQRRGMLVELCKLHRAQNYKQNTPDALFIQHA